MGTFECWMSRAAAVLSARAVVASTSRAHAEATTIVFASGPDAPEPWLGRWRRSTPLTRLRFGWRRGRWRGIALPYMLKLSRVSREVGPLPSDRQRRGVDSRLR